MKIAKVFPRKTSMSPNDDLCFFESPGLFPPEVDEVHISLTWDHDVSKAEKLYHAWKDIAPTKIDGPVISPGGEFTPGMYVKPGILVTSRGCPNSCWFCRVWRIEGKVKELEIKDGFNIIDDNLLACSKSHIRKVFEMLKRNGIPAIFSGGLDTKFFDNEIARLLDSIKINQIFFAYDTDDDFEPLVQAVKLMSQYAYYDRHKLYCYVLIGFVGDSFEMAEKRMDSVASLNITPKAMLWHENKDKKWQKFQREYYRNALLYGKYKSIWKLTRG